MRRRPSAGLCGRRVGRQPAWEGKSGTDHDFPGFLGFRLGAVSNLQHAGKNGCAPSLNVVHPWSVNLRWVDMHTEHIRVHLDRRTRQYLPRDVGGTGGAVQEAVGEWNVRIDLAQAVPGGPSFHAARQDRLKLLGHRDHVAGLR